MSENSKIIISLHLRENSSSVHTYFTPLINPHWDQWIKCRIYPLRWRSTHFANLAKRFKTSVTLF